LSFVRGILYGILGTMPGVERSWAFLVLRRAVPNLSLRSARALVALLRTVRTFDCGFAKDDLCVCVCLRQRLCVCSVF
jgi:hypothetical protein